MIVNISSSYQARRDFMRTIHNTIRESVRRMSIPTPTSGSVAPLSQSQRVNTNNSSSAAFGRQTYQRPETLEARRRNMTSSAQPMPRHDVMRYSVNIEERVDSILERSGCDVTRSHTLTDLNNVDLTSSVHVTTSGSQSTIGSDASSRDSASARLVQSSGDPRQFTSQTALVCGGSDLASPVWKPRHLQQVTSHSRKQVRAQDSTPTSLLITRNSNASLRDDTDC